MYRKSGHFLKTSAVSLLTFLGLGATSNVQSYDRHLAPTTFALCGNQRGFIWLRQISHLLWWFYVDLQGVSLISGPSTAAAVGTWSRIQVSYMTHIPRQWPCWERRKKIRPVELPFIPYSSTH